MKVALFIKDKKLNKLKDDAIRVLIFNVEDNKITGMEDDCLPDRSLNYMSLWLIGKQIKVFYIQEADEITKDYFQKLDIEVKTYADMQESSMFKAFIF